jgi:hypothetical protein
MTNEQYRALPRISNSDLSNMERSLFRNSDKPLPTGAYNFGSAVHERILEPHLNTRYDDVDYEQVQRIQEAVSNNQLLSYVINNSQKEKVVLWDKFGLPLKSKLDLIFDNSEVWDLKTTSCSSKKAFEQTCIEYGYHRQGAFYLDSIGAKNFTFVAISKVRKKDPIFIVQMTDRQIQEGRKKYEALLTFWKNNRIKLPNT